MHEPKRVDNGTQSLFCTYLGGVLERCCRGELSGTSALVTDFDTGFVFANVSSRELKLVKSPVMATSHDMAKLRL